MTVFWFASFWMVVCTLVRARSSRLIVSLCLTTLVAAIVALNISNFRSVNRLFQILHTYPLPAESLVGTPWRGIPGLTIDHEARSARVVVPTSAPALDAEFEALVQASIGQRAESFRQALAIYQARPIGSPDFVAQYIRLFYPTYNVDVAVEGGSR